MKKSWLSTPLGSVQQQEYDPRCSYCTHFMTHTVRQHEAKVGAYMLRQHNISRMRLSLKTVEG
jgi:hypothetical protein